MALSRASASALLLLAALAIPACSSEPAASSTTGTTTTTGQGGTGGNEPGTGGNGAGGATTTTTASGTGGAGGSGGAGTGGSGTGGSGVGGNGGSGGGASVPLAGFGAITGDCGILDAMEIQSPDPFVFRDAIDFGMDVYDYSKLSPGGQVIYDEGNLGGSSLESEIMSYEVLYRCELAALLKTEGGVVYQDPAGKKTDLLVDIDGFKVGVSVTRAYGFPPDAPYTEQQAHDLLQKKLSDIKLSSANVAPRDAWVKQILHVMAYTAQHADTMEQAYGTIDPAVRADTILWLTVTEGADEFIY